MASQFRIRHARVAATVAAVVTCASLSASEQSGAGLLEAALSAAPQDLASSYLIVDNQLALLALVAGSDATNLNLFFGAVKVTKDNLATFEDQFQGRKKAYDTAIRRRGFPQVAGEYRLELEPVPPCAEEPFTSTGTLKQEEFRLEFRPGSLPDGESGVPGAAVENTVVFGRGDFASGTYLFGTVTDEGIDLRPFSGPGCVLRLTPVSGALRP